MSKSVELPNVVTLLHESPLKENSIVHHLVEFESLFFISVVIIAISIVFYLGTKKSRLVPGPLQNALEMFTESLFNLIESILGKKHGEKLFPYLATLFVFIAGNNFLGMLPLMKSSTSLYTVTLPLALFTFVFVQVVAVKHQGVIGYLYHLAGTPKDIITWILAPFMFCLHLVGELARPVSLSVRLFGNILGEDIMFGVFTGFGVTIMGIVMMWFTGTPQTWIGIPLELPFMFLGLMTSIVQALVFTLLSTIYFSLALSEESH